MREIFGNLWEVEADLRVISTNPIVNRHAAAVMGRGCALEAKARVPDIEYHFAKLLKTHGNRVMRLARLSDGSGLASFPVKHHWKDEADPDLIRRSAKQLAALADKFGYERVVLPRPGCGNGRLCWDDIKPILADVLDDRFAVITFPQQGNPRRGANQEGISSSSWRVVRESQRTFRTGDVERHVVASGLTKESAEAKAAEENERQLREWAGSDYPLAFHLAEPE